MPPSFSFSHQVPRHGQQIFFGEGVSDILSDNVEVDFPQLGIFDGRVALIVKGEKLGATGEAVAPYYTDADDRRVWLAWYPADEVELDGPPLPDRTPGQQTPVAFLNYPVNVHMLLARRLRENCQVPRGGIYSVGRWLSVLQLADPDIHGNQDVFITREAEYELLQLLETTYPFRSYATR